MEAPKLEVANSVVAAEKQTQTPIDVTVLPRGVLPTSRVPSPVREQPPSMSRTIWNVAALPTRRFPRVDLSLATFRRIRTAIRIAKPVTVGAILVFAALLVVWWNQRSAKSNIGISQGGGVRDTLRSTSRKGTSEAQAGTPSPPLIIRPDTPAVTETVVQTHDAAVAGAKPPTPPKRNAPFDPLIY